MTSVYSVLESLIQHTFPCNACISERLVVMQRLRSTKVISLRINASSAFKHISSFFNMQNQYTTRSHYRNNHRSASPPRNSYNSTMDMQHNLSSIWRIVVTYLHMSCVGRKELQESRAIFQIFVCPSRTEEGITVLNFNLHNVEWISLYNPCESSISSWTVDWHRHIYITDGIQQT